MPAGNPPTVTTTVTNALGLSASYAFSLQGGPACATSPSARLAGGLQHTVALKQDGTVWAWGRNADGQLGDGTTTARPTPAQALGVTGVAALVAGGSHTLALKQDGTVWAWGRNAEGQLGDGTAEVRLTPVQVPGLSL
ncbi:hypothetical protein [Corallococcus sp. AB038B]|uniref:RCC1 domain-containing protein n=1 Tax=Corallococcus sp. AB038B TaxID=2316718 RepID=UPI001F2C18EC|nr:hypothetical protein [Corallococcus sp. AB038B]